jgi:hypothetical protein
MQNLKVTVRNNLKVSYALVGKKITFTEYVNIKYSLSTSSAPYIDQENYMPMFLICYIHHGILLDHCQTCY